MSKLTAALVAAFFCVNSAAAACFDRSVLKQHLAEKFNETPVSAGLAANGSVIELFAAEGRQDLDNCADPARRRDLHHGIGGKLA